MYLNKRTPTISNLGWHFEELFAIGYANGKGTFVEPCSHSPTAAHEPQTRTRWHARGRREAEKEGDNKKSVDAGDEVGELLPLPLLVTLQHVASAAHDPRGN